MDILENQIYSVCQNHPNHKVSFLKISKEKIVELKCDECAIEENYLQDFISLQTIELCSDDYVFVNWPPVNDINLLKQIKSFAKSDAILIEQIQNEFDQLIQEITSHFTQKKKKMIQQIITLREKKEEIINLYKSHSKIDKLKQLTKLNKLNIMSQIQELKVFVSDFINKKDLSSQIFQEQFNKLKGQQLFQFDDFDKLKNKTQTQINDFKQKIKKILVLNNSLIDSDDIHKLYGTMTLCISDQSRQIECEENLFEEKITIKKNYENLIGQAFFKYGLNKHKKYTVRFKFNDEAGDYFMIGLIDWINTNNELIDTHLAKAFCNNISSYGGKVIQGSRFYQVKKDQIIEMRIDIQMGNLQFLDYPNYSNINELNNDYPLNSETTYYLAIYFGKNDKYKTCIDLIYFQEI